MSCRPVGSFVASLVALYWNLHMEMYIDVKEINSYI